jgi:hypothetical protein
MNKNRATMVASLVAVAIAAVAIPTAALSPAAGTAPRVATDAEPTVSSIPVVTDWRQITLPLDAYVQDAADRQVVLRAEYAATKECMESFGFDFNAPQWDKPELADLSPSIHYRLYGLLDLQHAQTMGYHAYVEEPTAEAQNSAEQHPDGYDDVLATNSGTGTFNGQPVPDGGCIGKARVAIEGTSANEDLVSNLDARAYTAHNTDSRVKFGFEAWSNCMSKEGYTYKTPMDANNDNRWSGPTATTEEIAVATADVNCKLATNLVGIRMAVDAAYQRQEIASHATELAAMTTGFARQLTAATLALAKDGSQK